ncbi:yjcL [Symbiodinium sp. KB8]|nr:yjcL [Symbiodinium sp. KB8]
MTVAKKALSKCMKPYRRVAGHAEADNGSVAIELREYEGDPGETVTADGDQVGLTQNPTLRKESADGSTNSGNEQEGNVVASTTPRESLSEGESYGSGVPAEPSFEKDSAKRFTRMLERGQRLRLLGCFVLAVVVLGAGFGLSQLVPENNRTLVLILFITTCSLLLSFIPAVRNVRDTFTLGEYIILIFFTAVGMLADVRKFGDTNPLLFAMVAVIAVLGVGLHFVLAAIFRFDVDTFIISSVCNVLSPPFVGMAAIAIDNKELVVPGVTAGIIGYAVGNYIGIGIAYLCEAI